MIALSDYLILAALLFSLSVAGIFFESQKHHYFVDVHRVNAAGGKPQLYCLFTFSG